MDERRMLELAAKAAGVCLHPEDKLNRSYGNWGCDTTCMVCKKDPSTATFRPLTDDGDALRLAVALRLSVCHHHNGDNPAVTAMVPVEWHGKFMEADEPHGDDPGAATRLAITRAAAAIGEELEKQK